MAKQDIKDRNDVYRLVSTFYDTVRNDKTRGPFFNNSIKDWDAHLEHLTTFWESSLFLKTKYSGDPLQTHIDLDKRFNHSISEMHFGIWLNLWIKAVNALFEGDYAENAKHRARKMRTFIFLKMFEARS